MIYFDPSSTGITGHGTSAAMIWTENDGKINYKNMTGKLKRKEKVVLHLVILVEGHFGELEVKINIVMSYLSLE